MKYVMALDQGTTSSRCILFDKSGKICSTAQKEFTQFFPQPGWVEHDAEEIWNTTLEVSRSALTKLGIKASDVDSIGITNQRETTVLWDRKTGKAVCNAIVWQCRRTSSIIDDLVEKGLSDTIKEKTGLIPDAYFSGSKIKWLLDNVPGLRERAEKGEILFGTIDSWLIWRLTGGKVHATDYTNASRTMLFNIHTLQWDDGLLKMLDIPRCILPEVKPSSGVFGKTVFEHYQGEITISGAAGDQQCALFGQCCFEEGEVKNTYGTGCFLLMNTGKKPVVSKNGLVTTIAVGFSDHVEYALEGSIFAGGAAIQWLRDQLALVENSPESEEWALKVEDTSGCYVVPAFTGLGAPYWNQNARGIITGITRGTNRAHLIRATLESLAYQTHAIVLAMEQDSNLKFKGLKVDGGASANNFLMQFQSDILNERVIRPTCIETTALGAAYLAGLATGFWKDRKDIKKNWAKDKVFSPAMDKKKRQVLLSGWEKAVKASIILSEL